MSEKLCKPSRNMEWEIPFLVKLPITCLLTSIHTQATEDINHIHNFSIITTLMFNR